MFTLVQKKKIQINDVLLDFIFIEESTGFHRNIKQHNCFQC